jgi:hypothetical protein
MQGLPAPPKKKGCQYYAKRIVVGWMLASYFIAGVLMGPFYQLIGPFAI